LMFMLFLWLLCCSAAGERSPVTGDGARRHAALKHGCAASRALPLFAATISSHTREHGVSARIPVGRPAASLVTTTFRNAVHQHPTPPAPLPNTPPPTFLASHQP